VGIKNDWDSEPGGNLLCGRPNRYSSTKFRFRFVLLVLHSLRVRRPEQLPPARPSQGISSVLHFVSGDISGCYVHLRPPITGVKRRWWAALKRWNKPIKIMRPREKWQREETCMSISVSWIKKYNKLTQNKRIMSKLRTGRNWDACLNFVYQKDTLHGLKLCGWNRKWERRNWSSLNVVHPKTRQTN
jgi:hypothetical protein